MARKKNHGKRRDWDCPEAQKKLIAELAHWQAYQEYTRADKEILTSVGSGGATEEQWNSYAQATQNLVVAEHNAAQTQEVLKKARRAKRARRRKK